MLRMSFIVPFTVLNFVCGVAEIDFVKVILTLIATLPGIVIHLFIGTSIPVLADLITGKTQDNKTGIIAVSFITFGTVLGLASGIYLTYVSKQKY